jgi:glutamate synthase (NADPH/NADH) large chain
MGVTEANQILTLNGLRHKVTLRTDGGIKTGRDVVIAAMMGAEEFGIGTTSLVAMGCIMVRQCHSNTCPVGICTQDEGLRKKFTGTPEKVVNLFTFIAEEVREILSQLGFSSLTEIIGRSDLLKQVSRGSTDLDDLDLSPLLIQADPGENKRYSERNFINKVPSTLDEKIYQDIKDLINTNKKIEVSYKIKNIHRAVGTRLSHYIFKHKNKDPNITVNLVGSAGQSLGAFGIKGLKICVTGDANDYVGKGLSGATIIVKPSKRSNLISDENTIIGNTVLYGATSGKLFASGQAGERFAVRNSGAEAVIEGCASNGCEYMTGGTVVILGKIGDNFGAGMTGGMAFIYYPNYDFENYVNYESVVCQKLETQYWKEHLKNLIKEHFIETQSIVSKKIIENFDEEIKNFVQVCPKEMLSKLENPISFKKKFSKAI